MRAYIQFNAPIFIRQICSKVFQIPGERFRDHRVIPSHWEIVHFAKEIAMNGIIYLIGLVVVILAVLSLIGLR